MGLIEVGHQFSQHSLNTFARCRRRFLLRYLDRQPWPVPEDVNLGEYEEHLRRGRILHEWIARTLLGLPAGPTAASSDDALLRKWWGRWTQFDLSALPVLSREVELPLVVPLGPYCLYARFDLLALGPDGAAIIVDWKTLAYVPSQQTLRDRIQTRVYLYAAVAAGHVLTGGAPLAADRAAMRYWFAEEGRSEDVRYSAEAYARDARFLCNLVEEIASLPREGFTCTGDARQCVRCNYRSLCQRDSSSETGADWREEDIDFALDLDDADADS